MWEDILNLALKNGLWAVLFLGLLIFVLKDSKTREKKYQETISDLTDTLNVVHNIENDVQDIKKFVRTKIKKDKVIEENETEK